MRDFVILIFFTDRLSEQTFTKSFTIPETYSRSK